MKYRRIVFVNRYYFPDESATSQMLSDLARRLVRHGCAVLIVSSRQTIDNPSAGLPAHEVADGVEVERVWTSSFGRAWLPGRSIDYLTFYLSAGWRLLRLLGRADAVVAMTDPPLISILAWWAAWLRGAALINWLQDLFPEVATELGANPLPHAMTALLRRLRNASLRASRTNVALGTRMAEYLRHQQIPENRISVIENWAEESVVAPRVASDSLLRATLGSGVQFVVGYSGNFGRAHEFETLLEAAELLRDDPAIHFLMIGAGARLAALRAAVVARGLMHFSFLPPRPRDTLADTLAAADVQLVSLLPRLEGLIVPSKFYGILAAGRPTLFVGDADGEIARCIAVQRCGINVPQGDGAKLAAAIRKLRAEPGECAAQGVRARALFESHYTADRARAQWQELLNR